MKATKSLPVPKAPRRHNLKMLTVRHTQMVYVPMQYVYIGLEGFLCVNFRVHHKCNTVVLGPDGISSSPC